jgi:hypothetical protein
MIQHMFTRLLALLLMISAVAFALLPASTADAYALGSPVRLSPVGHTVGEVSIETSPTNPQAMIANTIDSDQPGTELVDQIRCAMYQSSNAGTSWIEVSAWPRTAELKPLHDPWVAVAPDGTMHATCIANVSGAGRVAYIKSIDNGLTWSQPTTLPAYVATTGADKSVIEVGSDGRLLVCYRQSSRLILAQSTNQGSSWTTKSTGINAHCNGITTAPGGYITIATMHGSSLNLYGTTTSANNGTTWGAVRTLGQASSFTTLQFPSVVRDYAGRTVIAGSTNTTGSKRLMINTESNTGALLTQWQLPTPSSSTCSSGRLVHPQLNAAPNRLPALQIMCKVSPTQTMPGKQETWFYAVINQSTNSSAPVLASSIALPPIAVTPAPDSFAGRFPDGGYYWDITWSAGGWLSMSIDPVTGNGPGELVATPVVN